MKALIVSSGSINDYKLLKGLINEHDFIICADGGIRHLMKINIKPNLIIGDLDSIDEYCFDYIKENNIEIIQYPVQKDETDTELAVMYLINKGYKEITLTGVTGSRIDHSLANIYLLRRLMLNNIKSKIIDDNNTIYIINTYLNLKKEENYYVSVIPISIEGIVVTLDGFFYPLDETFIEFGSTLGISNRIIYDFGKINILKGEALVIVSKD